MTKEELLDDIENLLDQLHDQIFKNEEKTSKYQEMGLDIDAPCIALDDVWQLKKLMKKDKKKSGQ